MVGHEHEAEESTLLGTVTKQRLMRTVRDRDSVCAVVRSRVLELVRMLQLLVVTSYKSLINQMTTLMKDVLILLNCIVT
jgi:hypothetical protein